MRGIKTSNDYADVLPSQLYGQIPKTVLAAVAVSFAMRLTGDGNDAERMEKAVELVLDEWRILHENGIVPQKPAI